MEDGYVKFSRFKPSKRKLSYACILTPAGILAQSQITARFSSKKIRDYEALIGDGLTRELQKLNTQGC